MNNSETILVINDEALVREMITLFLQNGGYNVIESSNGKEGLLEASQKKPDLILLDIIMPEMNGFQVCEELKKNEDVKDIPVIFLSSLTDPKDKIRGLEVGGVDFVTRAQDRGEILARVKTHLKISSLTKALEERNQQLEIKQKHLDEDLQAAALIQKSLLPSPNLNLKRIKVSFKCYPCELIGGDIFNILPITPNISLFYILDVSGHGVPAAMVTVSVSEQMHVMKGNYLLHLSDKILAPAELFKSLNQDFPLERFDKFFSIFFAVFDSETKSLKYANAGHPPPILIQPNQEIKQFDVGSTFIGADEELIFKEEQLILAVGSKLIMYTDGLIELENEHHEFFGMERLLKVVEKTKDEPIEQIINAIFQASEEFRGRCVPLDDLTLFGLEFVS